MDGRMGGCLLACLPVFFPRLGSVLKLNEKFIVAIIKPK